eukprot:6198486-Pleurochrysis_carterae.AAC.3
MRSKTETTHISTIETALNDLEINKERLGPSTLLKAKVKIHLERLVDANARVKRSKQKAYEAAMKYDTSSSSLYKGHKAKLASRDMTSIHKTLNWDNPNTMQGETKNQEEIMEEASRFYKWIYS